jgi:hypothetical protein
MNPTAFQILEAFARPVAALPCHWADPGINSVNRVSDCIRSGGQPQCVPCRARAALEAAAKAPGLADDLKLISSVAQAIRIADGRHRMGATDMAITVLCAVDTYHRGGK